MGEVMADIGRARGRVSLDALPAETGIEFVDDQLGFRGTGDNGRCWRLTRVVAGWRLEFRDPGDKTPTYAGMFGTRERAMEEANRDSSRARLSRG